MLKLLLTIFLIIILSYSFIAYADNTINTDSHQFDSLYKTGKYEEVINQAGRFLKTMEDWGTKRENGEGEGAPEYTEESIIHARILMADSYRMLGMYSKARDWYAGTVDGYFDSYAEYCYEILSRISVDVGLKLEYYRCIPYLEYDGRFGSNPLHEITLIQALGKLMDDTSLLQKKQYFKEMASYDQNNDWVTQLTKFCSGDLSLSELWPSIPKEFIDIVSVYAGLSLEASGDKTKARELYQKALTQKDSRDIEFLFAKNRLGLFTLKMMDKINSVYVYAVKASSAKYEDKLYTVQNLIDNDPQTAWVPDSKTGGIGEWTELSFDDSVQINSLTLTNGYAKSDVAFKNNNRIKTATLIFFDGSKTQIALKDTMKSQVIKVNKKTRTVRLVIDEVYKGTKYDDTCLSGLDLDFKQ